MTPFLWALLAAVCWGVAPMFEKVGLRGAIDPTIAVFVRSLGVVLGAFCFLPYWSRISHALEQLTFRGWAFLLLGGLCASIIGQICFYRALKLGEVSRVVPIGASYPVIAFCLGILIFKEPLTLGKSVGAMLVMAGIFLLR